MRATKFVLLFFSPFFTLQKWFRFYEKERFADRFTPFSILRFCVFDTKMHDDDNDDDDDDKKSIDSRGIVYS